MPVLCRCLSRQRRRVHPDEPSEKTVFDRTILAGLLASDNVLGSPEFFMDASVCLDKAYNRFTCSSLHVSQQFSDN